MTWRTATITEQRQITRDCFNGRQERDCDNCPAHHESPNGICCFGDPTKFGGDLDKECRKCTFRDECEEEVNDYEDAEVEEEARQQNRPASRFDPASWRSKSSRTVIRRNRPNNGLVQIGGLKKNDKPLVPIERRRPVRGEDASWEFFFKDVVWGGLEGLFAAALAFIRNHQWR